MKLQRFTKDLIHGNLSSSSVYLINNKVKVTVFDSIMLFTRKTSPYSPPEDSVSTKGDVYSLGVFLYEMLFNQTFESGNCLPFGALTDTLYLNFDETIPISLQDVITCCLFKNPEDRPSMDEVLVVLKGLFNGYYSENASITCYTAQHLPRAVSSPQSSFRSSYSCLEELRQPVKVEETKSVYLLTPTIDSTQTEEFEDHCLDTEASTPLKTTQKDEVMSPSCVEELQEEVGEYDEENDQEKKVSIFTTRSLAEEHKKASDSDTLASIVDNHLRKAVLQAISLTKTGCCNEVVFLGIHSITSLEGSTLLQNLQQLSTSPHPSCEVFDLSPLVHLLKLECLRLTLVDSVMITLSVLASMSNLKKLSLKNNSSCINYLSSLLTLESLSLDSPCNLSPITSLVNLRQLKCNDAVNLQALSDLNQLKKVSLKASSSSFLSFPTQIEELDLTYTNSRDPLNLDFLMECTSLNTLCLCVRDQHVSLSCSSPFTTVTDLSLKVSSSNVVPVIKHFSHLEILSVERLFEYTLPSCPISIVLKDVASPSTLKSLSLDSMLVLDVEQLKFFGNLEHLHLRACKFLKKGSSFDCSVLQFHSQLKQFTITWTTIHLLHLLPLYNLEVLVLKGCRNIGAVHFTGGKFTKLKVLDLSHSDLICFEALFPFERVPNLTELYLTKCHRMNTLVLNSGYNILVKLHCFGSPVVLNTALSLRELEIEASNVSELSLITEASNLETLYLHGCSREQEQIIESHRKRPETKLALVEFY
ncbi:hypothetical protein RCL1_008694 [Eukaryota sp. TZLM3-RCL]